MAVESRASRLCELKVVELKAELEKRKCDSIGVKAVLVKRLEQLLTAEGKNPNDYLFNLSSGESSKTEKDKNVSGNGPEDSKNVTQNSSSKINIKKFQELVELKSENKSGNVSNNDEKISEEQCNDDTIKEFDNKTDQMDKKSSEEENHSNSEVKHNLSDKSEKQESVNALHSSPVKVLNNHTLEGQDHSAEKSKKIDSENEVCRKEDEGDKVRQKMKHERNEVATRESVDSRISGAKDEEKSKNNEHFINEEDHKVLDEVRVDDNFEENDVIDITELHVDDEEVLKEINGMDNEDSINLTLGEEDTKFMKEEGGFGEVKDSSVQEQGLSTDKSSKKSAESTSHRQGEGHHISSPGKAADGKDSSEHRNLWVSNLSSTTRATDLKHIFSKHGKVIAAKIVTNAKTPGARCYGFVTMATCKDAAACIKAFNTTELHGRIITVETVANKPSSSKKTDDKRKSPRKSGRDTKSEDRTKREKSETKRSEDDKKRERAPSGGHSSLSGREHPKRLKSPGVLSFQQIKEEREKQRRREREREMREAERRRKEQRERQEEIERRQRHEAIRLDRMREKLQQEREKIEREKVELLRLERERLEREKEELRRQQLKLEEARRIKRPLSPVRPDCDNRKRHLADDRHYDQRAAVGRNNDFKKDSVKRLDDLRRDDRYEARNSSRRYPRREEETLNVKSRYNERDSGNRSTLRRDASSHNSRDRNRTPRDTYESGSSTKRDYGPSDDSWSKGSQSTRDTWPDDRGHTIPPWVQSSQMTDRWVSSSSMATSSLPSSRSAANLCCPMHTTNMPMVVPSKPQYQIVDRFDAYKTMSNRKY